MCRTANITLLAVFLSFCFGQLLVRCWANVPRIAFTVGSYSDCKLLCYNRDAQQQTEPVSCMCTSRHGVRVDARVPASRCSQLLVSG
ncbi:hypothetical protein PYCCODRAFT_452530 [Trametes coccinea BRFM310]|uniref:Extracellular membrane protein CFEM domain-containing protein n=1 Tax=Trametes coccinea (strain BRFM310) TaxID=1353009 RepID=A0A1Y2INP9_TRAC3|nr:hypothetical protein PYCCODRAFT_452530 [Trametes coccinea BRFM310]